VKRFLPILLLVIATAVHAAGAAPRRRPVAPTGYVDDSACAGCHADIARSYQQVGMARSFFRPRKDDATEDFGKEFVHAKSRQTFQLVWRDGKLLFRRYQRNSEGQLINLLELQVNWVLGSGEHARVYLYQTPAGELYQLPVAWYSRTRSWGMAPGYDRPDHDGVGRRVRHECMFCHNAYPEAGASSDGYWRSQSFPSELPQGTGCQRCHGPGAEHVAAMKQHRDEKAASTIVNPARLTRERQRDVCYQCHLLPAVSVQGARRFGRDVYSFRPGQNLSDYEIPLDITNGTGKDDDRFEISQHAARLEKSRCFLESFGKLSCVSCHDPHRAIPAADRAAHFRQVCLGCHRTISAGGPDHAGPERDSSDCVACHMPPRRTHDVVHVVMTDHRISGRPGGAELLAPRAEADPPFDGVRFFDPSSAPKGWEGELFRILPLLRSGLTRDLALVTRLRQTMASLEQPPIESLLDLANAEATQREWSHVEATCRLILQREPAHPLALAWLGLARGATGDRKGAVAFLRRAVSGAPDRAGLHFNLAEALTADGDDEGAAAELESALSLRPTLAAAWLTLARLHARHRRYSAAADAYRRTLALEPADTQAYLDLARTLRALGDEPGARRLLQHALTAARDRKAIEQAVAP
jgi:predicted CXXCH cytochrome family protein